MQEKAWFIHHKEPNGDHIMAFGGVWARKDLIKYGETISNARTEITNGSSITLDISAVKRLDTVIGFMISGLIDELAANDNNLKISEMQPAVSGLLEQISTARKNTKNTSTKPQKNFFSIIENIGKKGFKFKDQLAAMLSFFGKIIHIFITIIRHPKNLHPNLIATHIEQTGLTALPIVGLLSFLIGVVLAYQAAAQLEPLGAQMMVVDLLGISIMREIGVIMTAIIVAGRSGSAFTAQIGAMQLGEEIDAMRVMGFDPFIMLVSPRIIALAITLPLLVFFADIAGMIGGAIASWALMDISFTAYIQQFETAVSIRHFWIGIIKAPVFAMIIAMVGCYQGLIVRGGADAVGRHTTSSVVISIFMVILIDAIFSIIFQIMGL